MIITVTGKPCSGKGAASKILCEKYGFDYLCAGDIMRDIAEQEGYENVLDFQLNSPNVKEVDKFIDNKIAAIGKQRVKDNLLIDSRLAWHFVEKSFKVFVDVEIETACERLIAANRKHEQATSKTHAEQLLTNRWNTENERYLELYKTNNTNKNNYDFVIDSTNLSPEQMADMIYKAYQEFEKSN